MSPTKPAQMTAALSRSSATGCVSLAVMTTAVAPSIDIRRKKCPA
jgi:hypothetical protein